MASVQPRNRDTSWFIDLLTSETNSEYQASAALHALRGDKPPRRLTAALAAFLSFAVVGVGFSAVALLTSQTAPAADATRLELVERVTDMQARVESLEETNARFRAHNANLEELIVPIDAELAKTLAHDATFGGYKATRGRGIKIFIRDQGAGAKNASELLMDADIQIIINGLWSSGATSIEVNNIRITAATSIRNAGKAVLIDYSPIRSPYTFKAIGPTSMKASFERSVAAAWVRDLSQNYPIDVQITARRPLRVKAGTMPTVEYAQKVSE
ncbi:MAG: hypothetical protein RL441_867 [Actinomycetota bacterium]|jgi:uncharacterized protein YlxW (UPF0749 family)